MTEPRRVRTQVERAADDHTWRRLPPISYADQLVARHGQPMRDAIDRARVRYEADKAAARQPRSRPAPPTHPEEPVTQPTEVQQLIDALADCVVKATPYGIQDGEFVANYIMPTGPIHRAIPLLQDRYGITVRPGFDGRTFSQPEEPA